MTNYREATEEQIARDRWRIRRLTVNVLRAAGIESIEQAASMGDNDLLKVRNFGRKMLAEVRAAAKEMNVAALGPGLCWQCRFWVPDKRSNGHRGEQEKGECHRRAPLAVFPTTDPKQPEQHDFASWPLTFGDAWCGEFERLNPGA